MGIRVRRWLGTLAAVLIVVLVGTPAFVAATRKSE